MLNSWVKWHCRAAGTHGSVPSGKGLYLGGEEVRETQLVSILINYKSKKNV